MILFLPFNRQPSNIYSAHVHAGCPPDVNIISGHVVDAHQSSVRLIVPIFHQGNLICYQDLNLVTSFDHLVHKYCLHNTLKDNNIFMQPNLIAGVASKVHRKGNGCYL